MAAPSGTGKTSLVRALVQKLEGIRISISYTTRPPRPGDEEGVDYRFVTPALFQEMVKEDSFLEHAEIYGHHYGTAKPWLMERLDRGIDVILEIDWQGARQIRDLFKPAKLIFILPPSLGALRERLEKRSQDSPESVEERLEKAQSEMEHYVEFDYLVINDDFDQALQDLVHIVSAERLQCVVQRKVADSLLAELLQKQ